MDSITSKVISSEKVAAEAEESEKVGGAVTEERGV